MTIQRRSDHKIQIIFKDSNNDAIALDDIEAQVWEEQEQQNMWILQLHTLAELMELLILL